MCRPACWLVERMKRKYIVAAILTVLVLGALLYFYGGHQTPPGQPPLRNLTAQNLAEIEHEFNAAKDSVRVLALLSPT